MLATGGGAYMDPGTRAYIKSHGVSVWLKADLKVLLKRVGRRDNRPLLAAGDPAQVMKQLMSKRYPIYAEDADVTVESRDVPHEVMVGTVIDAIAVKLGYRPKTSAARRRSDGGRRGSIGAERDRHRRFARAPAPIPSSSARDWLERPKNGSQRACPAPAARS